MEKPKEQAAVVSRNELSFFVTCVRKAWEKIIHRMNPKHNAAIECCGSYRRNTPTCHECIILLKSDIVFPRLKDPFQQLIHTLQKIHLLSLNSIKSNNSYLYEGILDLSVLFTDVRTNQPPTQSTNLPVILKVIEPEAWPCALLYWTGPNPYWIKLQSAAQRANYELTPEGLFVRIGHKRLRHRDEYDVLMDIGVEYQEPLFRH
jgi:DNA polymerase/3'-5' exonuclease PolX